MLHDEVETLARQRFEGVDVKLVDVREATDFDGDDILVVQIVLDAEPAEVDPSRLSGFTRHLRRVLERQGENRYPITRFFSASDYNAHAA